MSEEIKTLSENIKKLSEGIKTLSAEIKTKSEEAETKSEEAKTLSEGNKTLSAEIKTKSEEIKTLSAEIKTKSEEIKTKSEEAKTLLEGIKTKSEEAETKSAEIKNLLAGITTKSAEIKTKSEEAETKSAEIKTKSEEAETKSEETKTLSEGIKTLSEDITTKSEEIKTKSEKEGKSSTDYIVTESNKDFIKFITDRLNELDSNQPSVISYSTAYGIIILLGIVIIISVIFIISSTDVIKYILLIIASLITCLIIYRNICNLFHINTEMKKRIVQIVVEKDNSRIIKELQKELTNKEELTKRLEKQISEIKNKHTSHKTIIADEAQVFSVLADYYGRNTEVKTADKYYKEAIRLYVRSIVEIKSSLADAYFGLAELRFKDNNLKQSAIDNYQKALNLYKEINNDEKINLITLILNDNKPTKTSEDGGAVGDGSGLNVPLEKK